MRPLHLRLLLLARVFLDSVDELLARARQRDVLDADVDTLLDISIADSLVDDHADGGFGDVVDDAGFAVVDLVGHSLEVVSGWQYRKVDVERSSVKIVGWSHPFWTAPLALISTMSPTLRMG